MVDHEDSGPFSSLFPGDRRVEGGSGNRGMSRLPWTPRASSPGAPRGPTAPHAHLDVGFSHQHPVRPREGRRDGRRGETRRADSRDRQRANRALLLRLTRRDPARILFVGQKATSPQHLGDLSPLLSPGGEMETGGSSKLPLQSSSKTVVGCPYVSFALGARVLHQLNTSDGKFFAMSEVSASSPASRRTGKGAFPSIWSRISERTRSIRPETQRARGKAPRRSACPAGGPLLCPAPHAPPALREAAGVGEPV